MFALTDSTTAKQLTEQVARKSGVSVDSMHLIAVHQERQRVLENDYLPFDALSAGGFSFLFLFFSFLSLSTMN